MTTIYTSLVPVLPLENGSRLMRQEFERRYEAMPYFKKAERIEGVVYQLSNFLLGIYQNLRHLSSWTGILSP
jgi:hypothetical protein